MIVPMLRKRAYREVVTPKLNVGPVPHILGNCHHFLTEVPRVGKSNCRDCRGFQGIGGCKILHR